MGEFKDVFFFSFFSRLKANIIKLSKKTKQKSRIIIGFAYIIELDLAAVCACLFVVTFR